VRRLLLALVLLLIPPALSAQGLGDAAARERQKRAKEGDKKPARVYTGADLRKEEPKKEGEATPTGETDAQRAVRERDERQIAAERTSEPGASENAGKEPRVAEAEAAVESARGRVAEAEARVEELKGRLNPQSTTFIYGATGSNVANEELQVRADLTAAEAELSAMRQALVEANRALDDARAGRPAQPGKE